MDIQTTMIDLFPVVFPILVAMIAVVGKFFWNRLPENMHQVILGVATTAVTAVEQLYGNDPGHAKKAAAESMIVDMLAAMHVKVAPALIDAAIESAVYALKQNGVTTPATPATLSQPAIEGGPVQIQGAA